MVRWVYWRGQGPYERGWWGTAWETLSRAGRAGPGRAGPIRAGPGRTGPIRARQTRTNETPNKGIQSDGTWFKCEESGTHDGGFAPRSSAPQPTWGSLRPASSARGAPRPIIGRTSRGPWVEPDHPIAKAASAPVPMGSQPRDGGLAPPPTLSEDSRQGNISAMRKAFNHHHHHHQGIQPHA